jgi:hypothetical protein
MFKNFIFLIIPFNLINLACRQAGRGSIPFAMISQGLQLLLLLIEN